MKAPACIDCGATPLVARDGTARERCIVCGIAARRQELAIVLSPVESALAEREEKP